MTENIGFGEITDEMRTYLSQFLRAKRVWALGSGPGQTEYNLLLDLGASFVVTVDKVRQKFKPIVKQRQQGIACCMTFTEFVQIAASSEWSKPDVVWVKWPDTTSNIHIAIPPNTDVVYIGKNDGITACGGAKFWQLLRSKKPIHQTLGMRNDLIVYSGRTSPTREPIGREEVIAFDVWF